MSHVNWRASPLHAAIVGVINSLIQLISAFGVQMTMQQDAGVTTAINALLLLASVIVITATNGPTKPST